MTTDRLLMDFETFSELPLKGKNSVGAAVYAEHHSTEILCLNWKFKNTGERGFWAPGMAFPQQVINHINQKGICEAHNVPFEFYIWMNKLHRASHVHTFDVKYPLPPIPMPKRWMDTLAVCAYRALPLGLDQVGKVLNLAVRKNKRGEFLIQKLSKPRKPTKNDPRTRCDDFDLVEEMYGYCDDDVDAEELLGDTIGDLPASEYRVWQLDQKINHRGVFIDTVAVAAAVKMRDQIFETMGKELIEITDGEVMTGKQVAKIVEWLTQHGYAIDNLRKETVVAAMEAITKRLQRNPENEDDLHKCMRVLELRQVLGNASSAKLNKYAQTVCRDGRCRGIQQYHGAGTGRFSGRLIQPHNLPRPTVTNCYDEKKKKWYLDIYLLIEHIKIGDVELLELIYGNPLEAISTALRSMIMAAPGKTFRVADFSAIEARGVMWLADEVEALKAFREYDKGIGPDIYCVMAEHLYERPINKEDDDDERQLGKITVLGCGYQMGAARMQQQAKDDFGIDLTLEQAEWLVNTYRETYSKIPDLWRGLEAAAISAIETEKPHSYRRITFDIVNDAAGKWLVCILPNGRRLWYYNPEMIETTTSWGAQKMSISYEGRDNKRGGSWQRVTTYGGMLTENVVQAISRDIMVEAMFRVEEAGYPIVLTVHDEVIAETPEDYGSTEEFEDLLKGPTPTWAKGFPINAEGWSGTRYRK